MISPRRSLVIFLNQKDLDIENMMYEDLRAAKDRWLPDPFLRATYAEHIAQEEERRSHSRTIAIAIHQMEEVDKTIAAQSLINQLSSEGKQKEDVGGSCRAARSWCRQSTNCNISYRRTDRSSTRASSTSLHPTSAAACSSIPCKR